MSSIKILAKLTFWEFSRLFHAPSRIPPCKDPWLRDKESDPEHGELKGIGVNKQLKTCSISSTVLFPGLNTSPGM